MADSYMIRGELVKVESFSAKGGGMSLKIQVPFSNEKNFNAGEIIKHANQICDIKIDFTEGQKELAFDDGSQVMMEDEAPFDEEDEMEDDDEEFSDEESEEWEDEEEIDAPEVEE